jgi:hypothetical protein
VLNSVGHDNPLANRHIPQRRLYRENKVTRQKKLQPRFTRLSHILHSEKPQATSQENSDSKIAKNWKVKKDFTKSHPPAPMQYRMVYSNLHLGLGTDIRSSYLHYPVLSFPAPPTPVSAASQLSGLSQPGGGPGRRVAPSP